MRLLLSLAILAAAATFPVGDAAGAKAAGATLTDAPLLGDNDGFEDATTTKKGDKAATTAKPAATKAGKGKNCVHGVILLL